MVKPLLLGLAGSNQKLPPLESTTCRKNRQGPVHCSLKVNGRRGRVPGHADSWRPNLAPWIVPSLAGTKVEQHQQDKAGLIFTHNLGSETTTGEGLDSLQLELQKRGAEWVWGCLQVSES